MPRSMWKGVVSFGMVSIPIRLYNATESTSKVSFRQLCPDHKSPISYKRWCARGDRWDGDPEDGAARPRAPARTPPERPGDPDEHAHLARRDSLNRGLERARGRGEDQPQRAREGQGPEREPRRPLRPEPLQGR